MKTEISLDKKIEMVASVLGQNNFIVNDKSLAEVIQLIEGGYVESEQAKSNRFAEAVKGLKGKQLGIIDCAISKNADKIYMVTGPIPGMNELDGATCQMSSEFLTLYLADALVNGYLEHITVRKFKDDLVYNVVQNGMGNILMTAPMQVEPNLMTAWHINVFVDFNVAAEPKPDSVELIDELQKMFPEMKVIKL